MFAKKLWIINSSMRERILKSIKIFLGLNNAKDPWQIAAGRYFVEKSEGGFTFDEYRDFVVSKYKVSGGHLSQFFEETIQSPSGRKFSRTADHISKTWIPPIELVSTIIDYDELVEARKNARQAFILSLIAIVISALSLIVSICKN